MKTINVILKGLYLAKVSGKITTVRVEEIRSASTFRRSSYSGVSEYGERTVYDVTNLETGRKTTFKSARKLRKFVLSCTINGSYYESPTLPTEESK